MEISRVMETCLYADDLAEAEWFYGRVLGLERVSAQAGRHLFFRCGDAMFLLFDPRASAQSTGDVPTHGAQGAGHVAFAVCEEDLPAWRHRLGEAGIAIEAEIRWPSGGQSIYFRDPAGNSGELVTPRTWGLPDA